MRATHTLLLVGLSAAAAVAACGGNDDTAPAAAPAGTKDPFRAQSDVSEGLTNVSADLDALLEKGALSDACQRYFAGQADRRTMLMCGKWMFFYESFGTSGPPTALMTALMQTLPDQIGDGYAKMGMILDPTSELGMPFGLAPGRDLAKGVPSVTFTCASCHFGRLPDGRYAVGAPNHDYDYGLQTLSFALVPLMVLGSSPEGHDPLAVSRAKPMVDAIAGDDAKKTKLLDALKSVLDPSIMAPNLTPEVERAYAGWKTGTQDFLIPPLPIDDKVHTVSKIPALWGLPDEAELSEAGLDSVMLGWTGSTRSFMGFLSGFVVLGGGDPLVYDERRVRPLAEYVYSLRPPANPAPPPEAEIEVGRALFQASCVTCHGGPRGSGKRVFTYDEIGTDRAMAKWGNDLVLNTGDVLTGGIKAPRLVGLWAAKRFLHNGAVDSLDELFCEKGPRKKGVEPYGPEGHEFGCDLAPDQRRALRSYLLAH